MSKRDFYEVLGVEKKADDKSIKSAFRKLAMANHPDRNQGDSAAEDRFREANEAYDILKDPQKRAAYDQMGHAAFDQSSAGGGGGFSSGGFSDIFDQMFSEFSGGGGRQQRNQGGNDLRYDMSITLEGAFNGLQQDISITVPSECEGCSGSGSADGSTPSTCGTCGGAGRVRAQQGFFAVERTCHACQGMGQVISDPCRTCAGEGRMQRAKTLAVSIPTGVDTGTRIRLSGNGEAGLRGGPAGDLYIFVNVEPHSIFTRDGNNLYARIPLPMTVAALGGSIEVPTLEGKMARLTIDAGTQSGRKFRMRGKGMPALRRGNPGDQIVEVQVETPTNLNKKQKELLEAFSNSGNTSPESASFLERVKRIWADS